MHSLGSFNLRFYYWSYCFANYSTLYSVITLLDCTMRQQRNRVSFRVEFDVLIEATNGVEESVLKGIKEILFTPDVLDVTTHWSKETEQPHFLFLRHVKINRNEPTKTERLFP